VSNLWLFDVAEPDQPYQHSAPSYHDDQPAHREAHVRDTSCAGSGIDIEQPQQCNRRLMIIRERERGRELEKAEGLAAMLSSCIYYNSICTIGCMPSLGFQTERRASEQKMYKWPKMSRC
jgi:hypothetical protein